MALNKENDYCEKISADIKKTFLHLFDALKNREIQLLRQVEVLEQHKSTDSYDNCFKEVTVIFDNENDILKSISNFGRINLHGISCDSEIFKIEDYQKPEIDHVALYKYLEKSNNSFNTVKVDNILKLINDNNEDITAEELLSEVQETVSDFSTIDTLNTILECIEKCDPSLCLHTNTEEKKEMEHSPKKTITKVSSSCDITSELSNLNSQCLNNSGSVPNLNCKCTSDKNVTNNDFLTQSAKKLNLNSSKEELSDIPEQVKEMSLKQPVQIQQWMKQIISETEIEPHANNMEHSHLETLLLEKILSFYKHPNKIKRNM